MGGSLPGPIIPYPLYLSVLGTRTSELVEVKLTHVVCWSGLSRAVPVVHTHASLCILLWLVRIDEVDVAWEHAGGVSSGDVQFECGIIQDGAFKKDVM